MGVSLKLALKPWGCFTTCFSILTTDFRRAGDPGKNYVKNPPSVSSVKSTILKEHLTGQSITDLSQRKYASNLLEQHVCNKSVITGWEMHGVDTLCKMFLTCVLCSHNAAGHALRLKFRCTLQNLDKSTYSQTYKGKSCGRMIRNLTSCA
jgi:hypothetical protein